MTSNRDEQRRILLDLITLFLGISTFGRPCENRYVEMKDEHRLAALVGVTACRIRDPEFWKDGDRRMRFLLRGLATALFRTIPRQMHPSPAAVLPTLMLLPELVPLLGDTAVGEYYKALSTVAAAASRCPELVEPLVHAVTEPLGSKGAAGVRANHMCITSFLTTPNLLDNLGASPMTRIRKSLALERISWSDSYLEKHISSLDSESRLWLLAHAIYLIFDGPNDETPVIDLTGDASPRASFGESFLELLSQLLSPVAVEISQRINIVDVSMEGDESDVEDAPNKDTSKEPLPLFVKKQLEWLVQPSSIYGLLLKTHSQSSEVQVLARFALTLLVAFPHKRNELRMWLCLAKTQDGVPAVRYVWNRVKDCSIFRSISVHFRQAVNALKPAQTHESPTGVEEELNLIFLFLEMYAFLLTVTDDNEFFAGYKPLANGRQLELSELKELTVFLKNLGFAMYWCSGEILGGNAAKDNGSDAISQQRQDSQRGWEIKQFREVVTNVTRAIYARE